MATLTSKYGTNKTGVFDWEVINSNTNAIKDRGYLIDASSNSVALTLLSNPSQGDAVGIKDFTDSASTNIITIARNGKNIAATAEDLIIDVVGFGLYMVYSNDTEGWVIVSGHSASANGISDVAYGTTWSGVSDIAPSKNVVYDEMELRTKAAAVIADNNLIRGDGGARGVQESTIVVDDSGRMTNSSQPCFLVNPTDFQLNISIDTDVTVIFGTEVFDIGNNFASNIFTAPITGKYLLSASIYMSNCDTAASYYMIKIVTSNKTYMAINTTKFTADTALTPCVTGVVDMDINDTVYVVMYQSGGTAQTDISASSNFSGSLIS